MGNYSQIRFTRKMDEIYKFAVHAVHGTALGNL